MIDVLTCIAVDHDPWLVALAAIVCAIGSFATLRLFYRARASNGVQRLAWIFMTSTVAGAAIWSTHFIAMLAFTVASGIAYDPVLTAISLLVAIGGTNLGFTIAARHEAVAAPIVGGAIIGGAISAMHYIGMLAYQAEGIVRWRTNYVVGSVVLAALLAAAAMCAAHRSDRRLQHVAAGLFFSAIVGLHFTAMTAIRVIPIGTVAPGISAGGIFQMALVTALMALVVIAAGGFTYVLDAAARKERDKALGKMAQCDGLTGLANRPGFERQLADAIAGASTDGAKVAVISIDMKNFSVINGRFGQHAGDRALQTIAARMTENLQQDERVGRVGGDEFGALKAFVDRAALAQFLARLEAALSKPIEIDGKDVPMSARLGVAIFPDDAVGADQLLDGASLARCRASSSRPHCFYNPQLDEAVRARRSLAGDLRGAIDRGEMSVAYQLQARIADRQVVGCEALARWNHPERGAIAPIDFISVAEHDGQIAQIGEWVLNRACTDAARWIGSYPVAVNVSSRQLIEGDLQRQIHEALLRSGLPPRLLEIELTESTIMEDQDRAFQVLRKIKAMGVRVALDDFGTGHSSLAVLGSFPFDKIKLDRCFVTDLESSASALAIVRAVIALGRTLGIPILAEGIETEGQLAILRAEHCDQGQGYLLGRPGIVDFTPRPVAEATPSPALSDGPRLQSHRAGR